MINTRKTMIEFLLLILQIFPLLSSTTSLDTKISNGLSLKMIHSDSPNSPIYRANITRNERMKEYIEMSFARMRFFARLSSLRPNEILTRTTLTAQSFTYLVQVQIGTFDSPHPTRKTYHLMLDTGSDLIWTQCEGCKNCFHQVDPYFPYSRSSTYRPFHSSNCPPGSHRDQYNGCRMAGNYVTGKVYVIMATEVFTFVSEAGPSHPLRNVTFGCEIDMRDIPFGENPNNKISGIMGMGYGDYSFTKQSESILNGKFSYCLQPLLSKGNSDYHRSPTYLRFGDDVLPEQNARMQTTPLYKSPHNKNGGGGYYLNLQGISVAGLRLQIPPVVFAIKRHKSGGCIIDSGVTVSWLVPKAYNIFTRAVKRFIKSNVANFRLSRKHKLALEFCWVSRHNNSYNLPEITFHFKNRADFILDEQGSFTFIPYPPANQDLVCLAFLKSTAHENYFNAPGVYQQINHRIIYDTKNYLLHFAKTDSFGRDSLLYFILK